MMHIFNIQCEGEFCLFLQEGIAAKMSEEAELIASIIHGETRKSHFEENAVGCCAIADLTVYHDFPCPACLGEEHKNDDR